MRDNSKSLSCNFQRITLKKSVSASEGREAEWTEMKEVDRHFVSIIMNFHVSRKQCPKLSIPNLLFEIQSTVKMR